MSLSDYIHRYAPAKDKNDPVKYTNDMVNRFNQVIGRNVITKDTSLGELKEALIEAGLDPEHTITKAHLQTEDPRVLKDLGITYGVRSETSTPMPPARKSTVTENKPTPVATNQTPKAAAPTYNTKPTFTASPFTKPADKVETKPTTTPAQPKKPNRQEISKKIEAQYKIKPTEQQLDIITNPNISLSDKLIKLGVVKEVKENNKTVTETKDPNFIQKAWMYMFESDVPINETNKIKEAADGNPVEDEEVVSVIPKATPKLPSASKVPEDPKIKQRKAEDESFTKAIGYSKVNDKVYKGKSYKNLNLGSYSKLIVDMSDGITVAYQPRNGKKDNRTEVNNAVAISDYLYDFDFTDNVFDVQANNQIENLKYRWKTKDYTNQPFVQVRENLGGGKYKVKIKAVKDLTQQDFDQNKIYRQGYAKLSDFDITPDQKKIKLFAKSNSFVGQGLPFRDENNKEHGLRVGGGKGNVSVNLQGKNVKGYLDIASLNQFGPYLGGTVTIISEDGKTAKKVSGSLKDILETAFYIKKQTGSKDVYFLQSDAGSMNIKADANNGKITPAQLAIARNQEPQAGAAEILLNE
jgi:hypothetical protein